ncbi:serine/threonine-protein kinase [Ideonella sp. DXS22W]|uniref:Serine/threonine-protein kinase n=1 Tax=Pseudaquabacterium inlustre TaxID=2984192 RepID=A0ABU9CIX7_9BURK
MNPSPPPPDPVPPPPSPAQPAAQPPGGPDWPAIKAAFGRLAGLGPAERAAGLAPAALQAAGLGIADAAELQALLAAHDAERATQGLLDGGAVQALADDAADEAPAAPVGERLGAWAVVRALGAGGMGEVVEVQRADGRYQGRAAAKLLRPGLSGEGVLRRFAQERQALARLEHPHIARLLDAGATAAGRPFFVLEYVDGQPIDRALAGLPLRQRVQVFLQLADAVAHAHRQLLVHRDLKPGNVLVDARGQVKLLDFGIAKALDPAPASAAEAEHTQAGQRPFTPQYASPEQVRGEPVGTATDIYSLGVLLYRLLTGVNPTGRDATTPAEAARRVLDETPTRPSSLSPALVDDPGWLATRRHLAGDLDNILLKALEKEPARRYASVDALAADLQAWLDGRPVSARAATWPYLASRFVRRHRAASAASALALLAVLGGAGVALHQARQADAARARAESHLAELRRISRDVVVAYGDAITHVPGGAARKIEMLQTTAATLERLASQVDAQADAGFAADVAGLYARLADLLTVGNHNVSEKLEDSAAYARRAVALYSRAGVAGVPDADSLVNWAQAHQALASAAQARRDFDAALRELAAGEAVLAGGQQRWARAEPAVRGRLVSARGALAMRQAALHYGWGQPNRNDPPAALAALDRAGHWYLQALGDGRSPDMEDVFQLGTVAGGRALVHARLEAWDAALAAARDSIAQRQRALALAPHNRTVQGAVAADQNLLGGLSLNVGDSAGALAATAPAWATLARLIAEEPAHTNWRTNQQALALNHGRALLGQGRAAEALPVLGVAEAALAPLVAGGQANATQQRRLAQVRLAQAQAHHRLGERAAAQRLGEAALAALRGLTRERPTDRDAWLVQGEVAFQLAAWQAGAGGAAGARAARPWQDEARSAYARAAALRPLTAEHARRAAALPPG